MAVKINFAFVGNHYNLATGVVGVVYLKHLMSVMDILNSKKVKLYFLEGMLNSKKVKLMLLAGCNVTLEEGIVDGYSCNVKLEEGIVDGYSKPDDWGSVKCEEGKDDGGLKLDDWTRGTDIDCAACWAERIAADCDAKSVWYSIG